MSFSVTHTSRYGYDLYRWNRLQNLRITHVVTYNYAEDLNVEDVALTLVLVTSGQLVHDGRY